jgi:hypothetical protein
LVLDLLGLDPLRHSAVQMSLWFVAHKTDGCGSN